MSIIATMLTVKGISFRYDIGHFTYLLEASGNIWFSNVFREYRKSPVI